MSKSKQSSTNWTPICVWLITIGFCLFIVLKLGDKLTPDNAGHMSVVFILSASPFIYYISVFVQNLIMVTGHMIFGLLSGYSFGSFRIKSLLWTGENEKIKFSRKSGNRNAIAVFLLPPETKDNRHLAIPYILGGAIANLLSAGFFLLFFILTYNIKVIPVLMMFCAVTGLYSAAVQLLPFGYEYNNFQQAYVIKKNPDALKYYDAYMKINKKLSEGVRPRDMPDSWFEMPEINSLSNPVLAANAVVICNRYIDNQNFSKAAEIINSILKTDNINYEYALRLLTGNKIYCDILSGNAQEILKYMNEEQLRFINSRSGDISFLRIKYAYTLICENNPVKADKIKAEFEKISSKHLYPGKVQTEQELIEIADKFSFEKA